MKKRKMILSVMLLLSITTGCAAGEAKALSDSKGRMSLSQQIAKCNSKESAISIAENGIEKIFGANKYALAGDASYNQDSSIQPDGWFTHSNMTGLGLCRLDYGGQEPHPLCQRRRSASVGVYFRAGDEGNHRERGNTGPAKGTDYRAAGG